MVELTQEQIDEIREAMDNSDCWGMPYEEGVRAVLDVLEGFSTVEELVGG